METVERPIKDKLFDAVPFTFKPNLKNSGNPLYAHKAEARGQGKLPN